MTTYPKRDRDQAILICDIAASSHWKRPSLFHISRQLAATYSAGRLAVVAVARIGTLSILLTRADYAETAQRLREGWTP